MGRLVALALVLAASLVLAACGGDDGDDSTSVSTSTTTQAGGGSGGGQLSLAADAGGALAYQETSLTGKTGKNTIDFENPASLAHDVCVKDSGGEELGCSDVIEQGNATLDVDLEPGTYTYFCSVDGHEAAGMKGTLTVE